MIYISDRQIAERWGVHRTTPWRLARENKAFPQPIKLTGHGCTRWKISDIEAWEAAQEELE